MLSAVILAFVQEVYLRARENIPSNAVDFRVRTQTEKRWSLQSNTARTINCQIQKWWEVVCSAYLLVSLHSEQLGKTSGVIEKIFAENPEWDEQLGWKNLLNNLRLILEPFIYSNRIKSWLKVFPIPQLEPGLLLLTSFMNFFGKHLYLPPEPKDFYFSSA